MVSQDGQYTSTASNEDGRRRSRSAVLNGTPVMGSPMMQRQHRGEHSARLQRIRRALMRARGARQASPRPTASSLRGLAPEEPIPGWVWQGLDMTVALYERDVAALFRILQMLGMSQRKIAGRTGQSQSEICEVMAGRRVGSYDVLVRIAEGLGVPRGRLGLAYTTDADEVPLAGLSESPVRGPGVIEEMRSAPEVVRPARRVRVVVDGRCMRCAPTTLVGRWTGHESGLLRAAMRMTVRGLAAQLGVSDRMVSKWEAGGRRIRPRPANQASLDAVLARASSTARQRFALLLQGFDVNESTAAPHAFQSGHTARADGPYRSSEGAA